MELVIKIGVAVVYILFGLTVIAVVWAVNSEKKCGGE